MLSYDAKLTAIIFLDMFDTFKDFMIKINYIFRKYKRNNA